MNEHLTLYSLIDEQRVALTGELNHQDGEHIIPLLAVKERKAGLGPEQLIGYAISNDSFKSITVPTGPVIATPIIQWQGEKLEQLQRGKAEVLPVIKEEVVIGWRVRVSDE
jgi:hypothetical protein